MRYIYYAILLIIFFCVAIISALIFTRLLGLDPLFSICIAGICCFFIYYQKDALFRFLDKYL